MMKTFVYLWLLITFACPLHGQSQTPFLTDSAAAYLRTIAVDIGARPMGSANERAAMEFALRKFREFGLSEAYIMPILEYPGSLVSPPTNVRSGVAVGVLRGATSRIIVLGAHMDSADPNVPGANDDGSGSAAVIELARVLSQRKNQSTIVFALFGGEEAGLQGSRHFVENFPDTNRIALMLQLDKIGRAHV
jgi:acetylornithine deacetylase/succinyl-diaminopimelate desuccinylase-like protein